MVTKKSKHLYPDGRAEDWAIWRSVRSPTQQWFNKIRESIKYEDNRKAGWITRRCWVAVTQDRTLSVAHRAVTMAPTSWGSTKKLRPLNRAFLVLCPPPLRWARAQFYGKVKKNRFFSSEGGARAPSAPLVTGLVRVLFANASPNFLAMTVAVCCSIQRSATKTRLPAVISLVTLRTEWCWICWFWPFNALYIKGRLRA